jgi:hypothetical protein
MRVSKESIVSAMTRTGSTLRELQICGFENFSDSFFAGLLQSLPSLIVLILR